ncbi:hypothetical protein ACFX1T_002385 [Malus domestica]
MYPDEQILKSKIELLNMTNRVDYAMDIHKSLYHTKMVSKVSTPHFTSSNSIEVGSAVLSLLIDGVDITLDRRNKEDYTYNCPSPSAIFKFGSQEGSNIGVVLLHLYTQPNSEPARIGTSWRFGVPGKQNDVNPWRFTVALKGWTCPYKVLEDKLLWSQQHSAARAAAPLFLIAKWVFSG